MTVLVGIVGAGEIARKLHLPVLLSIPQVKVGWLADINATRAQAIGSAYGVRPVATQTPEDLPPCDVVMLAIPANVRAGYLQHFSRTQTAVFCEKPFAASASEHLRLVELYPPHRLGCAYMRRFYSSSVLMQRVVEEKWLGPLLGLRVSEGNRSRGSGVDQSFLDDKRSRGLGGALADLGSHTIDLALRLSGAQAFEVESVELVLDDHVDRKISAKVRLMESPFIPSEGLELDYCVSWLDRQANTLELRFERTSLWSPIAPNGYVYMGDPGRPDSSIRLDGPAGGATTANQAFYLEWQAFLKGVATQQESSVSASSALLTTQLIEKIYEVGGIGRA